MSKRKFRKDRHNETPKYSRASFKDLVHAGMIRKNSNPLTQEETKILDEGFAEQSITTETHQHDPDCDHGANV